MFRKIASDCNSSRVKWINWKKTSDREDVAQSKRRTNMIVELNDANALRDRSNTYKQVESAVDYMGAKKEQS
jgi:hypothetical protein